MVDSHYFATFRRVTMKFRLMTHFDPVRLCDSNYGRPILSHHTVVWGYLVYCLFCLLFVFCTVTDFSAAEKARGVKLCMRVGLLSGQVFSPFGEDWLAGSHAGGGISRAGRLRRVMSVSQLRRQSLGIGNWGRRRRVRPYGGVCVLQACWRTCFFLA